MPASPLPARQLFELQAQAHDLGTVARHVVVGEHEPDVLHPQVHGDVALHQPPGLLDALLHLGMRPAVLVHQRLQHVAVQREPGLPAVGLLQAVDPLLHRARIGDGLVVQRTVLGHAQLGESRRHRVREIPRQRIVVRQQAGLFVAHTGAPLQYHRGGHAVHMRALRRQHAVVGGVADQRMPKQVVARGIRRHEQPHVHQGPQAVLHVLHAAVRQPLGIETPSPDRGPAQHLARRAELHEAAFQRVAQGDRNALQVGLVLEIPHAVALDQAGFQQRARELLDEQRDAVRAGDDVVDDRLRHPARRQHVPHHGRGLGRPQPAHLQPLQRTGHGQGRLPIRAGP